MRDHCAPVWFSCEDLHVEAKCLGCVSSQFGGDIHDSFLGWPPSLSKKNKQTSSKNVSVNTPKVGLAQTLRIMNSAPLLTSYFSGPDSLHSPLPCYWLIVDLSLLSMLPWDPALDAADARDLHACWWQLYLTLDTTFKNAHARPHHSYWLHTFVIPSLFLPVLVPTD
jgi:hypothetical protein